MRKIYYLLIGLILFLVSCGTSDIEQKVSYNSETDRCVIRTYFMADAVESSASEYDEIYDRTVECDLSYLEQGKKEEMDKAKGVLEKFKNIDKEKKIVKDSKTHH